MYTNICIEYTILFGPNKGKRNQMWLAAEDPEIKRILSDPRMDGKVIKRI